MIIRRNAARLVLALVAAGCRPELVTPPLAPSDIPATDRGPKRFGIVITPTTAAVAVGGTVSLTAIVTGPNGRTESDATVTWGSTDPLVATVTSTGVVTGVGAGRATITATSQQGTVLAARDSALVTVRAPGVILFQSNRNGLINIFNLYTINEDGSDLRQLTTATVGPDGDIHAQWSPDGSRIVFSRGNDLWMMNADGSGAGRVTTTPEVEWTPDISPDGTRLAYARAVTPEAFDIYVSAMDGSNPVALTTDGRANLHPSWSPDGTKIAFQSERAGGREIFVINADGTGLTQLTFTPGGSRNGGPDWSPDGRRLVFESERDGSGQVYQMAADGTGLGPVTIMPGSNGGAAWSPDGARLAFQSTRDDPTTYELYVMQADGTGQRNITFFPPGYNIFPSWRPQPRP